MSPQRRTISIVVFLLVACVIPWSTWITLRLKHVAAPENTLAFMASAASVVWEAWWPPT